MRGTSCTKFTGWVCILNYSRTRLWDTHPTQSKQKTLFSPCYHQPDITCSSLGDHGCGATKDVCVFEVTRWHPVVITDSLSLSHSRGTAVTLLFFFAAQASKLNFWVHFPSLNTFRQLRFIYSTRPVCLLWKHWIPIIQTVMNDIRLTSKVVFWQMLQRPSRRGIHTCIFVIF